MAATLLATEYTLARVHSCGATITLKAAFTISYWPNRKLFVLIMTTAFQQNPPDFIQSLAKLRAMITARTLVDGRTDSLCEGLRYYRFSQPTQYQKKTVAHARNCSCATGQERSPAQSPNADLR